MVRRFLLLLLPVALLLPAPAAGEDVVIAAVRSKDIAPYNQALKGFQASLEEKGLNPWVVPFDLDKGGQSPASLLEEVRRKKPALVLALGTKAAEAAAASIEDLPIVFSVLLNPGRELFRNGNVTGATMDIPFEKQFEVLRTVLPGARRIGILFNPEETGPVVESASRAARGMGLSVLAVPVRSEKELSEGLKDNIKDMDVLWMVADSKVYTTRSTQYVLEQTIKRDVPFVGLSPIYVKAGALFAISWDYQDLGRQAGELAHRILSGASPADLPMTQPRQLPLVLNLKVARTLGLKIPRKIVDAAEEVYE